MLLLTRRVSLIGWLAVIGVLFSDSLLQRAEAASPPVQASVSATSLFFSPQSVHTASPAQYLTLTSSGTAPLSVSRISLTGANYGDFSVSDYAGTCTSGMILSPGSKCILRVNFVPLATGSRSASLVISHNAGASPHTINLQGPFEVKPVSLPIATQNLRYSATLTATGGPAPYNWSIAPGSGTLPPGLTLNAASGIISGTPTVAGTSNFTVQVTNSNPNPGANSARQQHFLTVNAAGTSVGSAVTPVVQIPFSTTPEEFSGPFASWLNVKTYGAVGDGRHDDTAALQSALNALNGTYVAGQKAPIVLWLPAGKYLISSSLSISSMVGVAMIGQDPATTSIVWGGASGGTMLSLQGSKWIRISRLTWDGKSTAATGHAIVWDGITGFFPTANLESDEIFTGLAYGIRIGRAGETMVERVRFLKNTAAGISTEDQNALDVWVRDSYFSGCYTGVTNDAPNTPVGNGGGSFQVYNSVFIDSIKADMEMGDPLTYFSERSNFSQGSQSFFLADNGNTVMTQAQITLQGNTIVNPKSSPIVIGNAGPLMLIDNLVLLPVGAAFPVVVANDPASPTDVLTMGNTFTVSNVLASASSSMGSFGRSLSIGDRVASRQSFSVATPGAAPFRQNLNRSLIEVPPGASATQIQGLLAQAASQGQRTVVHIPAGYYPIRQTLVIAGGNDVQIVGDGAPMGTLLQWTGSGSGPVIAMENPARATFRDIAFDGGGAGVADIIQVSVNDVPGSRVLISNSETNGANTYGLLSDGLDQALAEMRSSRFNATIQAVTAIGGASGKAGATIFGRVSSFGGEDSGAATNGYTCSQQSGIVGGYTYTVQAGGQLTVEDNWHDSCGSSPNYVRLTDSGNLMLQAGIFATPAQPGQYPFLVDGFKGDVSLIGFSFWGDTLVTGDNSNLRLLAFGVTGLNTTAYPNSGYFLNTSTGGQVGMSMSDWYSNQVPGTPDGAMRVADQGNLSPGFVAAMFARSRQIHPSAPLTVKTGLTDVRFENIYTQNANIGIHLIPANIGAPIVQAYGIGSSDGAFAVSSLPGNSTGLATASSAFGWNLVRQDDGNFQFMDLSDGSPFTAVGSGLKLEEPVSGNLGQEWTITPSGDGNFTIRNVLSGLYLAIGSGQQLTTTTSGSKWALQPQY
jgi:hypothetical protein